MTETNEIISNVNNNIHKFVFKLYYIVYGVRNVIDNV